MASKLIKPIQYFTEMVSTVQDNPQMPNIMLMKLPTVKMVLSLHLVLKLLLALPMEEGRGLCWEVQAQVQVLHLN